MLLRVLRPGQDQSAIGIVVLAAVVEAAVVADGGAAVDVAGEDRVAVTAVMVVAAGDGTSPFFVPT
jgi:hypothetical protein